jgi:hypothetical protein
MSKFVTVMFRDEAQKLLNAIQIAISEKQKSDSKVERESELQSPILDALEIPQIVPDWYPGATPEIAKHYIFLELDSDLANTLLALDWRANLYLRGSLYYPCLPLV